MTGMIVAMASLMLMTSQPSAKEEYIDYAVEISQQYDVEASLIVSMMEHESTYNAEADSGTCKGLLQVNPKYHKERMERLEVEDLFDAYGNILVGTDYIRELIDQYGNVHEALMVYNMGGKGAELYKQGKVSYYARSIVNRAKELEEEYDFGEIKFS